MGRSISAFSVNKTQGKFGPFEDQMFLGDYRISILMRATTEQINGVWQGACDPFREGLSTGILNVEFTPAGNLLAGGTNRGWPVRGIKRFALERLHWSGKMPFESNRITIEPYGNGELTSDVFPLHVLAPVSRRLRRTRNRTDKAKGKVSFASRKWAICQNKPRPFDPTVRV